MEDVSLTDGDTLSSHSPKVSTIGTFHDESKVDRSPQPDAGMGLQGHAQSLHDHHHWGDVQRYSVGAKSVTSSVGVERDESVLDGGVDVGEVVEEQQLDEEAPTEIVLAQGQVEQPLANGVAAAGSERSTAGESASSQPPSKQGSMVIEAADSLAADRSAAGDLSPRTAGDGLGGLAAGAGIGGSKSVELEQPPSARQSEFEGEEDRWRAESEAELEDISLSEAPAAAAGVAAIAKGAGEQAGGSSGEGGVAPAAVAGAAAAGEAEQLPVGGGTNPFESEAEDEQALAGTNPFEEVNGVAAASAAAAAAAAGALPGGEPLSEAAVSNYQSRLMQQLTASEEDDLTVYRSSDMVAAAAQAPGAVLRNPAAPVARGAAGSAGPSAVAGANGSATPVERFEIVQDSAPAPAATSADAAREAQEAQDIWERTFKGLLYVDGVDALGRPVVVINADAVPPNMKSSALVYCKTHLEPVVNKGHYVLVFTAKKAKLPSMWIMGAYRTLPRPYRKNVQLIVLVRPSGFLKAVLAFMRPFVSKKAGRKIKQVESLHEISEATGGELTLQHLGPRFNVEVAPLD